VNPTDFNEFCREVDPQWRVEMSGDFITFWNSDGQEFYVKHSSLVKLLKQWHEHNEEIQEFIEHHSEFDVSKGPWTYKEKIYRNIFKEFFTHPEFRGIVTQAGSQTRGLMLAINKLIGAIIDNTACAPTDPLLLDKESLSLFLEKEGKSESPMELEEAFQKICSFCAEYNGSTKPRMKNDQKCIEVVQHLTTLAEWLKTEFANYLGINMNISVARGSGNYPRVPWIAICPPGQSVNKGAYVALCFGREGNGMVAGFAESATAPVGLNTVDRKSNAPLRIDVDGSSQETRYNNVFKNPLEIERDAFKNDVLHDHVRVSLDQCIDFLKLNPSKLFSFQELSQFVETAKSCGFVSGEQLEARFVKSLLTKPFVILTGNSGTGKTKLGQLLAHWFTGDREESQMWICGGSSGRRLDR